MTEPQPMKLEFTGRGTILLETVNYGPITFDFDDELIASMLMKVFIENCEDGIPVRAYNEEEKAVIHTILEKATPQSDGDPQDINVE